MQWNNFQLSSSEMVFLAHLLLKWHPFFPTNPLSLSSSRKMSNESYRKILESPKKDAFESAFPGRFISVRGPRLIRWNRNHLESGPERPGILEGMKEFQFTGPQRLGKLPSWWQLKYLEQMKKNRWFRVCKGWNPTPIVWGLFRKPFTRIPELNQPGFHGKKSEVLFRGFSGASKVCPKFDQPKTDQCCRFFSKPSWRSWYIYIIIPRTQLTSNFCR